jgi:carbonic anhydrase
MIPDDELEKLAGKYVKNPIPNNIESECEADVAKHDFIAGFRAAEKMMQDRWPDEKEFYTWLGSHKTPPAYQLIYDWLKQKIFNKGE